MQTLFVLLGAMFPEQIAEGIRKAYVPTSCAGLRAVCLGSCLNALRAVSGVFSTALACAAMLVVRTQTTAPDCQRLSLEVDVRPLQPQGFSLPEAECQSDG